MYRGNDKSEFFKAARRRVENNPQLMRYANIILDDWEENTEHWVWVCVAPTQEIVEWAKEIEETIEAFEEIFNTQGE